MLVRRSKLEKHIEEKENNKDTEKKKVSKKEGVKKAEKPLDDDRKG